MSLVHPALCVCTRLACVIARRRSGWRSAHCRQAPPGPSHCAVQCRRTRRCGCGRGVGPWALLCAVVSLFPVILFRMRRCIVGGALSLIFPCLTPGRAHRDGAPAAPAGGCKQRGRGARRGPLPGAGSAGEWQCTAVHCGVLQRAWCGVLHCNPCRLPRTCLPCWCSGEGTARQLGDE